MKLAPALQEGLVQCQLRLADQFSHLTLNEDFTHFVEELRVSNDLQLANLGEHLHSQTLGSLTRDDKSQLHVAEANLLSRLSIKAVHLNTLTPQCQLNEQALNAKQEGQENKRRFSLGSYLKQQDNQACRQLVWKAFQRRTKPFSEESMKLIYDIRQKQAQKAGFTDYAHYQLRNNFLNTPKKVKHFLASQTQALDFAPWNIHQVITQAKKNTVKTSAQDAKVLNTHTLVSLTQLPLKSLGLILEPISQKALHLWHENRFIGEIIVTPSSKFHSSDIRKSVIGHQFGQSELNIKSELDSYRDVQQLADALAIAIASLVPGHHHYFNAALSLESDMANVPTKWLSTYLTKTILTTDDLKQFNHQSNPQLSKLIVDYRWQLNVFKAKVALNTFESNTNKSFPDLAAEFTQGFKGHWQRASDMKYAFKDLIYQGPQYYHFLWQDHLAQIVSNQQGVEPKSIFNTLVVNEKSLPVSKRIEAILGDNIPLDKRLIAK